MKRSGKLIVGIVIALSFVVGLLIGILLNYPPQKESDLAGTIGKVNNYRNVKISDNDIKLRSDLMKDEKLLKKYKDYYTYQYTISAKLGIAVDDALDASGKDGEFSNTYKKEIVSLTSYKNFLKEARKDILIALSVLNNIYESDQMSISTLINNANNAIAQIRYRESTVTDFVATIESYLRMKNVMEYTQLKKAHDMLLLNQVGNAVVTKNKPMLKYLDKKEFYTTTKQLKTESAVETTKLNTTWTDDNAGLGTGDASNPLTDVPGNMTDFSPFTTDVQNPNSDTPDNANFDASNPNSDVDNLVTDAVSNFTDAVDFNTDASYETGDQTIPAGDTQNPE